MTEVEVTVKIDADGNIVDTSVAQGTFQDGSKAVLKVGRALGSESGDFTFDGEPERHTHGPEGQHVLRSSKIRA